MDRNPRLLSSPQLAALEDTTNEVFVSAVTPWELGIKQSKGKLLLLEPISVQVARFEFTTLPITFAHAEYAARLPLIHRDPFDRMLIAQAVLENLTLVTADAKFIEDAEPGLFLR